jgi:cyclase
MLRSRIIPCLLVHKKGLVKTVGFKDAKYVGDPINAVKIFNEKEADELMVLDIDATVENRGPNMEMIKNIAVECRMPFCYGGGITTVEQAKEIINLGAEKLAISSAALSNISLLKDIGNVVGLQSVIVVIDVKRKGFFGDGGYDIYTHNGTKKAKVELLEYLKKLDEIGIGEVVVNSIDRDGSMEGYDMGMVDLIRTNTELPITILGGVGKIDDIKILVNKYKVIGAGAGSFFVFKGKYRAVLISYPSKLERREINNSL